MDFGFGVGFEGFAAGEGSMYTCNIYLNSGFEGERTRFYLDPEDKERVTHALVPRPGLCCLFDQVRTAHASLTVRGM